MANKKRAKKPKHTPFNGTPKQATSECDSVQRAVRDSQRELDNREYGEGYGEGGKEALRHQKPAEDQGTDAGCTGAVEATVKPVKFPPNPPPILFEISNLTDAAEKFWGLDKGAIVGRSRKPEICWARFVCCHILAEKGMTRATIGELIGGRDPSTITNCVGEFKNLTESYLPYKQQAADFERYLWVTTNKKGAFPSK